MYLAKVDYNGILIMSDLKDSKNDKYEKVSIESMCKILDLKFTSLWVVVVVVVVVIIC